MNVPVLNHLTCGDPKSPVVVLLHGFLGSAADWDHVAGVLSDDSFCVALDLPGHGGSTGLPDGTHTMEGAARAVVGRLALYLALRHPERCAGLFLESASPGIEDPEKRAARRKADEGRARRLESVDFEEFLCDWYGQPLFASLARREGVVEKLVESRQDSDPVELARSLRGMGTGRQPSLWGELPGLRVPALAVAGERDGKFAGIARRMAGASPRMRVVVTPGAGHNVHAEAPAAYLALLRGFLDGSR
jgi:2-succinyl-6-hydroxy-2,4-cyclohexadiene-1-carboxylate synthase